MAAAASPALLVMIPLVLWSVYRRVRRVVGRQESKSGRHWFSAVLFPALILLLAASVYKNPAALGGMAGGLVVGIAAALWGLKLTRFEKTAEGFFYTPNAHIGIVLSLLFVGRLAYRLFLDYSAFGSGQPPDAQSMAQSPLTLLIFGTLAGYYTAYAIGLLRWRHSPQASASST